MVRLLDVNLLLALCDPRPVHHEAAHAWFHRTRAQGWATCPLTENGFIRIASHPKYPTTPGGPALTARLLAVFCADRHHRFWPDSVSLLDSALFQCGELAAHCAPKWRFAYFRETLVSIKSPTYCFFASSLLDEIISSGMPVGYAPVACSARIRGTGGRGFCVPVRYTIRIGADDFGVCSDHPAFRQFATHCVAYLRDSVREAQMKLAEVFQTADRIAAASVWRVYLSCLCKPKRLARVIAVAPMGGTRLTQGAHVTSVGQRV